MISKINLQGIKHLGCPFTTQRCVLCGRYAQTKLDLVLIPVWQYLCVCDYMEDKHQ